MHVKLEVVKAGRLDFDLVSAGRDFKRLEDAVEVINHPCVVPVHEHLGFAWVDLQANAAGVVTSRRPWIGNAIAVSAIAVIVRSRAEAEAEIRKADRPVD